MTNRIQRFIAFLLVLCIPIFAIAGCTNNDVANAANQVTTNANGTYSIDTKTTTPEGKLDVYMLDIGQGDAILLKVVRVISTLAPRFSKDFFKYMEIGSVMFFSCTP